MPLPTSPVTLRTCDCRPRGVYSRCEMIDPDRIGWSEPREGMLIGAYLDGMDPDEAGELKWPPESWHPAASQD